MRTDDKKYQCWVNEGEKILSFQPVLDYALREFENQKALIDFVFERVDIYRYRVQ